MPLRLALAGWLIGTPGRQCFTAKPWSGLGMPWAVGLSWVRQPLVHLIITLPLSRSVQEPSETLSMLLKAMPEEVSTAR